MVSDQEIVNGVQSLLQQSNPHGVTSINGLVQQLEAKLGLDLSHKASFIRDLFTGSGNGNGNGFRIPPPAAQQQRDHFALQHFPQFQHMTTTASSQQFPSPRFALPLHHQVQHHQPHPEELHFRYPPRPSPQQQQQHLYQYAHQQQHPQRTSANATPTPCPAPAAHHKKESVPAGTKRRGGPGGLNKVCGVSPELEAVVGEPALPRTQIVKQLWAYIRKHNLQDPSNKRKIICDDALRLVFETDCTDMFKMNKLLAKHIIPLDPTKEFGPDSKRLKVETESATENTEAVSEVTTEAVSEFTTEAVSEFTTEATGEASSPSVMISDSLARFFDTEEKEMPQSEAVRRLWDHIKTNQLEDELNPMLIMCDPKLQELFGCENFSTLEIAEMLMAHFFKQS